MNHSFEYLKKFYIIFGTPGAVYSGVFIVDFTHVFYTGLGLSLYILLPMLEFRELIVLENLITGKACHGGIEQTSAAIAFTHSWFKCLGK